MLGEFEDKLKEREEEKERVRDPVVLSRGFKILPQQITRVSDAPFST